MHSQVVDRDEDNTFGVLGLEVVERNLVGLTPLKRAEGSAAESGTDDGLSLAQVLNVCAEVVVDNRSLNMFLGKGHNAISCQPWTWRCACLPC